MPNKSAIKSPVSFRSETLSQTKGQSSRSHNTNCLPAFLLFRIIIVSYNNKERMNPFWLSLLCLAGTAMSQEWKDDFTVLSNTTSADDLDLDLMDELEKNGTIKTYVAGLLRLDSASSLRQACNTSGSCPPAYLRALGLRLGTFTSDSGTNAVVNDTNPPVDASPNNTASAARSDVIIGGPITLINYCKHTNRLLSFVVIAKTEVCFVPFPGLQSITFAVCSPQTRCRRNALERFPSGYCRPSCHSRRRLFVNCVRFSRPFFWYWKWVVVNLPKNCECSAY